MKIKNIIIVGFLIFGAIGLKAQDKEIKTIQFKVMGICGMCKERIENALDVKGVKYVNWEPSTHMCEVTYRTDKISEEEMHRLLNEAGHDTEKSKASDEAYDSIHDCCKYRESENH